MPLPEPEPDETEDEFISRCMSNDDIKNEFGSGTDQALGVCFSQFKDAQESKDPVYSILAGRDVRTVLEATTHYKEAKK